MLKTIFKYAIGGKIQTVITVIIILVIIATPTYLINRYKNAISDARWFKTERDKGLLENVELASYNRSLLIKQDSLNNVFKSDSLLLQSQIESLQTLILQQKSILKDKTTLIEELKKGIKCKNFLGRIVDC